MFTGEARMRRPTLPGLLVCIGLMTALSAVPALAQTSPPPPDFSAAERLLLMGDQLKQVQPPTTLRYHFQHSGTLETPFEDQVSIQLTRQADGQCCAATGEFLTGERRVTLPEVENALANPVTLYFLEHDIREMQRLTKGKANYFRKRIRMALYQGAQVRDVGFSYRSQTLAGQEIEIQPYLDDPNRGRFEQLARKRYVFLLSDAVPGSVVSIRTSASAEGRTSPLIEETLWLDGATRPAPTASASAALKPAQALRP
jgi:hypothetical protein